MEGAQLASTDMTSMTFPRPDGDIIGNSNIEAKYDTSMFRLRG